MSGLYVDFDLREVQRACDLGQLVLRLGTRRIAETAAREGLAESKSTKRYTDRTGALSGTARARLLSYDDWRAESEIVWPAKYASYVDEGTRPHNIYPKAAHGFKGPVRQGQSRRARTDIGTFRVALRWYVGGRAVFARMVHHPGSRATGFAGVAHMKAERVAEREEQIIAHELQRVMSQ